MGRPSSSTAGLSRYSATSSRTSVYTAVDLPRTRTCASRQATEPRARTWVSST
ncbi:Uncharacterised protein [Mycobacteroides abscessus subsp. abscessus]|nr:Uncharacterised protein [Mycobacteroides abscessus subsp. abscessus]